MTPPAPRMPGLPRAWRSGEDAVSQVIGFTFAGVIFMGLVATLFLTASDPDAVAQPQDLSEGPWRAQAEVVLDAILAEGASAWQVGEDGRNVRAADVAAAKASATAYDDMLAALDLPAGSQVRLEVVQTSDAGMAACPGTVSFGAPEAPYESGQAVAYRTWDAGAAVAATDDDGAGHTWAAGAAACQAQVEVRVHVYS